ncbi:MAG: imidazolonepropionase [Thermoplasmata archaeon]|nr:imidazolonepropionase [Thermoplasmata archaeon]
MIRADLIVDGIGDLATLADGAIPRVGDAMTELGQLTGAALAADKGRFVFVGSTRVLEREVRLRPGGRRVDADGGSVVPGFVDAHTHVLFAGSRPTEATLKVRGATYAEIARHGGGLFSTVRATRAATEKSLLDEATRRLRGLARHGATTVEVKSGYELTPDGELRLLRLIPRLQRLTGLNLVPTFLGAHAIPPEYADRADAYVDLVVRTMLPAVAKANLARFCDVFCEPGFFTVEQSAKILRAASALGLRPKIHADEFVFSGGTRLAAEVGAASADHLLESRSRDWAALAAAGVTAVLLPVTPFASMVTKPGLGRAMVDEGVAVALGSDCSPNSWVESMPVVLAHAVYSARLTPAEALTAATVNAAHAVGEGGHAGMIALGRSADFALFDVPSVEHLGYRVDPVPVLVSRQGKPVPSR